LHDHAVEEPRSPDELMLADFQPLQPLEGGPRPDAVKGAEVRIDDLVPAAHAYDVRLETSAFGRSAVGPQVARVPADAWQRVGARHEDDPGSHRLLGGARRRLQSARVRLSVGSGASPAALTRDSAGKPRGVASARPLAHTSSRSDRTAPLSTTSSGFDICNSSGIA